VQRLIASRLALGVVVALDQRPEGARLLEIARALDAATSATQRAVEILLADGLVERDPGPRPRYRLRAEHPALGSLVALARRALPIEGALDIVCRANPAVVLAARDRAGYVIAVGRFADPADETRLRDAVQAVLADRSRACEVLVQGQDELRRALARSGTLRRRLRRMRVLRGTADRLLPRSRRGPGVRLGRLAPSLPVPPRRVLEEIAGRFGLARVVVFGSAVRSDFGPGSDVDVLVEPEDRLGVDDVLGLRALFEEAFGRDVDLVNARFARPEVLRAAGEEGVVLYGRA
jgi:predicted nucleotidyltransferase